VPSYALYLPPFGPLADPTSLVELARRAEAAGWDGVFLWDHVLADGPIEVSDPWVVLGAMAAATSRIRLGTMVSPLPRRRPWVLARQAGTVSRLSGGRCVLGVGLGADEYGDFSRFDEATDLAERAHMADDSLAIIAALWSGEPLAVDGPNYVVDLPETFTEPHRIPIWVAGTLPVVAAAHRAVRHDGIVLLGPDRSPAVEDVERALDILGAAGLDSGRPYDIVLAGNASGAWGGDDQMTDIGPLVEAGMTWWAESLIHFDSLELTMKVVDAGPSVLLGFPLER
jgi:alkanesulfonate monooxygenase SsuD/methylene tetrahydromethanopterin reductase-like flavin-dependent oxidoreductase (luciferase family)